MTREDFKRKLTAILSADVVGYSRLMGEDDIATVRTLRLCREIIADRMESIAAAKVNARLIGD